jgi:hypothetical protein
MRKNPRTSASFPRGRFYLFIRARSGAFLD